MPLDIDALLDEIDDPALRDALLLQRYAPQERARIKWIRQNNARIRAYRAGLLASADKDAHDHAYAQDTFIVIRRKDDKRVLPNGKGGWQ